VLLVLISMPEVVSLPQHRGLWVSLLLVHPARVAASVRVAVVLPVLLLQKGKPKHLD
jgi:hypothetical protein